MSARAGPLLLILLSPVVVFLAITLIPHDDKPEEHRQQSDTSDEAAQSRTMQIKPPLSPSYISRYFQPKSLSTMETLFYDFDTSTTKLHSDHYATSNNLVISKAEHEQACSRLDENIRLQDQVVREDGEQLFAFNMLASNRIGLLRPLPDTRPAKCAKVEQNLAHDEPVIEAQQLGRKVSIIICYYNEAPSALLRTIYSILERSRHELIEEILIIDDLSEKGYDLDSVRPHISSDLVKLVRTERREGLIRARQLGADLARGDILIFLDSHVEANVGWLEPLIQAIHLNQTTIACPMIDLINAETMLYTASPMVRGGLTWSLHFKWDSVPSENLKSANDFAKPIETPTMAGGLYAISREYFYQLGAYDLGMNLWGGENIELSLRAWMCGGRIVILPCSRLGHIFRKRRPYGPEPGEPDSLLYNSHRSARVWLDDYISKFYGHQPDAASLNSGDVSKRIELRRRLKCNDFDWYMDNIYPKLRDDLTPRPATSDNNNDDEHEQSVAPKLFTVGARSTTVNPSGLEIRP